MDAMGIVERAGVAEVLSSGQSFLSFGGVETYLLFQQDFPLREFCAFEVLDDAVAFERFERGFMVPIADAAASHGHGLIVDSLVWRANPDYVEQLGRSATDVGRVNHQAVEAVTRFVNGWEASRATSNCPVIVAAEIGPRGDGYVIAPGASVSAEAAYDYHSAQIAELARSEVGLLWALTMTSAHETIGIVRSARQHGMPIVVSPTVETDGRLPDGSDLGRFIREVDDATGGYAVMHMVNCAHPTHLEPTLRDAAERQQAWLDRFGGLRANASKKSHAELDSSTSIDRGAPDELAQGVSDLAKRFDLVIVGGCCGTDAEHLEKIAARCTETP